jgi:hypothetical protein
MCGWTLVFCHGRIESASGQNAAGALLPHLDPDPSAIAARRKLPRTGTIDVQYLDEWDPGARQEAAWGAEAEKADPSVTAATPDVPAWWNRRWWGVGAALLLAVTAMLWHLSRPAPPPTAPQLAAPGTGGVGPRAVQAGWGEAALAAWHSFVHAATPEEKLVHVLDAERVAPVLRAYYEAHPDAEAGLLSREFRPLAGTPDDRRRGLMALGATPLSPDDRPMILFFRAVPAAGDEAATMGAAPRFLLDWETYIQERDGLVQSFLADPTAPRRCFRLAVERVHIFDDAGSSPSRSDAIGLKLRTPSGLPLARVAEIPAGSQLHARIDEQLRWGLPAYATLQLAWDTKGAEPRVTVTDLVCWHFPGLGGKPEIDANLSPLPPSPRPVP